MTCFLLLVRRPQSSRELAGSSRQPKPCTTTLFATTIARPAVGGGLSREHQRCQHDGDAWNPTGTGCSSRELTTELQSYEPFEEAWLACMPIPYRSHPLRK